MTCLNSEAVVRAEMMPGLKTTAPASKERTGSGCVYLIRIKLISEKIGEIKNSPE